MPLGATPSRWCVCQFHHFRTRKKGHQRGITHYSRVVLRLFYAVDYGGKRLRIKAGAAHQGTVYFRLIQQRSRVFGLYAAAVEDAHLVRDLAAEGIRRLLADS